MAADKQNTSSSRSTLGQDSDADFSNPRYRLRDLLSLERNGEDKDR